LLTAHHLSHCPLRHKTPQALIFTCPPRVIGGSWCCRSVTFDVE
jgi:hypothetical protein